MGCSIWDRESEADLAARQAAEQAAFDAAQAGRADRVRGRSRQPRRQRSSPHSQSAKRRAGRSPTALEQKRCLQALNQERLAFDSAQKEALKAFKTDQRAEAAAFEQKQKGNREDWRMTRVALKSAKPLPHLNPQTLESSIELQDR